MANIRFYKEVRIGSEYILDERDSQRVIERAKEIAEKRKIDIRYTYEQAVQELLEAGEIYGELNFREEEENITSAWEQCKEE